MSAKTTTIVIIMVISLFSCQNKQELFEVEIPERAIFEKTIISEFPNPAIVKTTQGPFEMEGLPYFYDNLIPFLNPENLILHYSKHHLGYANNLNKNILHTPLENKSIEEILKNLDLNNIPLRTSAGGFYNHNLYWRVISQKDNLEPKNTLKSKIERDFGSVNQFKEKFKKQANEFVGSGWIWLVSNNNNKLEIQTTINQDNPLMPLEKGGIPLLNLDLWEHAYYPTYKNDREKYIDNFIKHINWDYVNEKFESL